MNFLFALRRQKGIDDTCFEAEGQQRYHRHAPSATPLKLPLIKYLYKLLPKLASSMLPLASAAVLGLF